MSSPSEELPAQVRLSMSALSKAVREMTPVGSKPIPAFPDRFNLLAWPYKTTTCRICNYPGHTCNSIETASACRVAILSTIGFWEDISVHVSYLYGAYGPFHAAVQNNEPTYDMRLDASPPKGQTFEEIFVDRLSRNWLKFQAHFAGIRPKAKVILEEKDMAGLGHVSKQLNDFLLKGASLSDLFERSLAEQQ